MRLAGLFRHTPEVGKCLGALTLTLAITTTHAQSQFTPPPKTATVAGTVKDPSGAFISNATITLKAATGFKLETKTEMDGQFAIDAGPGEYTLNISALGFKPLSESISLETTTNLTKHVVLQIGEMCGPCITIEPPIELEIPSNPFNATLPLKPLPPLKLHPRVLKNRPQ